VEKRDTRAEGGLGISAKHLANALLSGMNSPRDVRTRLAVVLLGGMGRVAAPKSRTPDTLSDMLMRCHV
jgi:hypothetical protein